MQEDLANFARYQQRGGNLLLKPNVLPHKRLNLDIHLDIRANQTQHTGM